MNIKQLELKGFKSFKNRTVIRFGKGISSIVGPNGCGKSNVVDAFLWVMGETSPKNLRGFSMEDLIFKGTTTQHASGIAEVSLVMEATSENTFPSPYKSCAELMITRRLDRDGKSDYLINSKICRLKDIQEVFMDTGAGVHGFSFIEQGAVERFISSKPEQKRLLIESAAGISKFRSRKREAEKKLELTNINVKRLTDILSQQEDQLKKTQKQSEKAEKFKNLKQQIRDKDLQINAWYFKNIKTEQQILDTQITTQINTNKQTNKNIVTTTAYLEELKTKEQQNILQENIIKSKIDVINSNILDLEKQQAGLQVLVSVNKKDLSGQDFKSYKKNGQKLLIQIKQNKEAIISLESTHKTLRQKEESVKKSYAILNQTLIDVGIKKQSLETQLTHCMHQEVLVQERIQFLCTQAKQNTQNKEELEVLLIQKQKDFQKLICQKKLLSKTIEQKKQLNFDAINLSEELQKNVDICKKNIHSQEAHLKIIQKKATVLYSEWNSLKKLGAVMDSQEPSIQFILQSTEHKNIYKETAGLFRVSSPLLEQAISAYLGLRLKSVFCEDQNTALSALKKLQQNKKGFCRFILQNHNEHLNIPKKDTALLAGESGFQFFLKDKIEGDLKLINLLFTYGVVVEDIKTAFDLKPKYPAWFFITLNGEVLTQEGDLIGGGFTHEKTNILTYQRTLKEIPLQYEKQNKQIYLTELQLKKTKNLFQKSIDKLSELTAKNGTVKVNILSLQKDLEIINRDYNNLSSEITNIQNKIHKYNNQDQELQQKQKDITNTLLGGVTPQKVLKEELKQQESEYKISIQEKQILSQKKHQVWEEVTNCEKELSKVKETKILLTQSLDNENKEEKKFFVRFQEKSLLIKKDESLLQEIQKQTTLLYKEVQNRRKQLENFVKLNLREQINKEQSKTINLHKMLAKTQSCISDLNLQIESLSFKQHSLEETLKQKYQVNLTHLKNINLKNFHKEDTQKILSTLNKQLSYIGEVNFLALQEYKELIKENTFYQKQYEDLHAAQQKLNSVIQRIDSFCAKKFTEVFNQVNTCFSKVWPSLFEGGTASLVLVKDPEKHTQGIDIMVQPLDQKTQNMSLLSGGEKAMTAVAVIFSIFLVKPSPFCILDEVDAPLDDINISRFNSLLIEMAQKSQVIIVTHNKYTMRECDYLYGVTMAKRGVSQVMCLDMKSVSDFPNTL